MNSTILAAFLLTLLLTPFLYLRQKRLQEPRREFFFKILGSHFYFGYVLYRIHLQWDFYRRWPDIDFLSWANWVLVMALFILFGVSYMIRLAPVASANRPREIILPLLCAIMPFGVNESASWFHWIKDFGFSKILIPIVIPNREIANIFAFSLLLPGIALSVISLFYLRRAFSILTEAREIVTRGPYRFFRHPLYAGEILATIGCCLFYISWFNIGLTIVFIVCLFVRSRFEEEKIIKVFPEYALYKNKVGWLPLP